MKVKCRFTAEFEVELDVPDNATAQDIGEELSNVNIPENDGCSYVSDTFEPVTDANGDPKLFVND